MRPVSTLATLLLMGVVLSPAARAQFKEVEHPFILWTKDEAAAIRKNIEANDWLREQVQAVATEARYQGGGGPIINLFRYLVLNDAKAGDVERKYLLSFINAKVDDRRHSDHYLSALRYDALYDTLDPKQREALEATFRQHVQHELDHPYHNTRISNLPNMQLPRMFSAHLMTVALRDEKLIRQLWAAPSGFRWYYDEYLSDGSFYNEEFAKMSSLIGQMLLYCRGLDRLGLAELGYGFTGRGGASMRSYVESYVRLGYPRTVLPGGLPRYERIAMGDARGQLAGIFQHCNVTGHLPGAAAMANDLGKRGESVIGGHNLWSAANMNGRDHRDNKVDKLRVPHWFEILHAKYPDGPFGYFLAQMRRPGDAAYHPTPFWGLARIAPESVKAPPAPSYVAPERGFAFLRCEESPAYWESADPAVALQFATLYVHYTPDCFALLGYHAFNRPIYVNRTISAGYNGGPWDFSLRGHCGLMVDNEQAQPIGPVPSRHDFGPLAKFVAARAVLSDPAKGYKGRGEVRSSDQPKVPATEVYTNTDLSRALVLTREYLFDVLSVADKSERPRQYHWLVHAPGQLQDPPAAAWAASTDLQANLFSIDPAGRCAEVDHRNNSTPAKDPARSWVRITGEKRFVPGDGGWSAAVVQGCRLDDPAKSLLGKEWYDRRIGVRVNLLGEAGTSVFAFDTPICYTPGSPRAPQGDSPGHPETGGVSLAVARKCPRTIFAAVHEPFENGASKLTAVRRIAQTAGAVAVAVAGTEVGPGKVAVDDRVMVALGDEKKPLTLAGDGESFTFASHAIVRIAPARVEVQGPLAALRVKVQGNPVLILNGKPAPATVAGGYLEYR